MSVRIATTQNDLLLNSLLDYYHETAIMNRLISIINGESKVSLRIIDWFVTNYTVTFVVYMVNNKRFKVLIMQIKTQRFSKAF